MNINLYISVNLYTYSKLHHCFPFFDLQDIYVIAMEYFEEETFTLCNTVDNISVWTDTDVKVALIYHKLFPISGPCMQTGWYTD